jgi:hypothetical protein
MPKKYTEIRSPQIWHKYRREMEPELRSRKRETHFFGDQCGSFHRLNMELDLQSLFGLYVYSVGAQEYD